MTRKRKPSFLMFVALLTILGHSNSNGQVIQEPGTDYLVFEAEDFTLSDLNNADEDGFGTGFRGSSFRLSHLRQPRRQTLRGVFAAPS